MDFVNKIQDENAYRFNSQNSRILEEQIDFLKSQINNLKNLNKSFQKEASKKLKETDETSPIGGKSCGQKSECSYFYSGTISI